MTASGYHEGEIFLGQIAANQNLSGIVIKLAKEKGEKAKEDRSRAVGIVTRDGKPVANGRVGAWIKLRDLDKLNVAVQRGRTTFRGGYEAAWSPLAPDGSFAIDGLKPGAWYFTFSEPGNASTVVGPIVLKKGEVARQVDIAATPGASVEGKVENVPDGVAGSLWVIAFDGGIVRREVRVKPDGTYQMAELPPGRYGLKVGHDAYEDPHNLMKINFDGIDEHRDFFDGQGEPWRGAVVVDVRAGATARDVMVDFRPPEPFVIPQPDPSPKKPVSR